MKEAILYLFYFLWAAGILLQLLIKSQLKKAAPKVHDEIFAKSFSQHSIQYSINYVRFTLTSKKWDEIQDPRLIFLLHINRVLSIAFFGLVVSLLVYFLFLGFSQV